MMTLFESNLNINLLFINICLPLVVVVILLLIDRTKIFLLRYFSLIGSLLCFLYTCFLFLNYYSYFGLACYEFDSTFLWFNSLNIKYRIGVDGLSIFFILLTTFLIPLCILSSWESIVYRVKEFLILLFLIEFLLLNVFSVLDLFLFYIFFETILIPMFFIIGVWGSRERKIQAAYQFFLYTLIGSLFLLLAVLFIYNVLGSTDIDILTMCVLNSDLQKLLWFPFFISFAIKMPMVPVHLWLPEAHVEAPTAGSVLLAGILLKMGGYGILRFMLPIFPEANLFFKPIVFILSLIAIIYTSFTTLRQIDLKKIIAYSSVAHMNFVTLGMFSNNLQGIEGSVFLMITHGIVSSGLFLCIGILYERYGSRLINYYGGLVQFMPLFTISFLILILSNMGLPLTSSFIGETLILLGVSINSFFTVFLAFSGVILGGIYSIWLFNRICFGVTNITFFSYVSDLNKREFLLLFPLLCLTFIVGIWSDLVLYVIEYSLISLIN